jgi:spore germination cell wall hydrolase CwlJ-like protein
MNILSNAITGMVMVGAAVTTLGWAKASVDNQNREIECLATNIYHEARGEPIVGQIAVAQVTMNRVEHNYFPDDVCSVVWEDKQFSWTHDGRSDRIRDNRAYQVALNVAETVYNDQEDDPTAGSLFYHATYINPPRWTRYMEVSTEIGVHVFYQWNGQWN